MVRLTILGAAMALLTSTAAAQCIGGSCYRPATTVYAAPYATYSSYPAYSAPVVYATPTTVYGAVPVYRYRPMHPVGNAVRRYHARRAFYGPIRSCVGCR